MSKEKESKKGQVNPLNEHQLNELKIIQPRLRRNQRIFIKTPNEKRILKNVRSKHKQELIKNGFDPKKRMNLSSPQTLKFTS